MLGNISQIRRFTCLQQELLPYYKHEANFVTQQHIIFSTGLYLPFSRFSASRQLDARDFDRPCKYPVRCIALWVQSVGPTLKGGLRTGRLGGPHSQRCCRTLFFISLVVCARVRKYGSVFYYCVVLYCIKHSKCNN